MCGTQNCCEPAVVIERELPLWSIGLIHTLLSFSLSGIDQEDFSIIVSTFSIKMK
jgi:hypothetical protein